MQGFSEDDPRASWPDPPEILDNLVERRIPDRASTIYRNLYKLSGRSIYQVLVYCQLWDRLLDADLTMDAPKGRENFNPPSLDKLIETKLIEQVSKGNVAAARELRERQKEDVNREAFGHIEINFVPWTTKDKTLVDVMEQADEKIIYRCLKTLLERLRQERFPNETVELLEQFVPLWLDHANTIYYPKKKKTIQRNYKRGDEQSAGEEDDTLVDSEVEVFDEDRQMKYDSQYPGY